MTQILLNVIANILSGSSIVLFQILAAAMVMRSEVAAHFALWALAVSLAGFAPAFTFNLNSAVARRALVESGSGGVHYALLVAARAFARRYFAVVIVCTVVGSLALPWLYPSVISESPVVNTLGAGVFFLGSCWVVLAQPEQGVWIAHQNNMRIAFANIGARLAGLLVVAVSLFLLKLSIPQTLAMAGVALCLGIWIMRRQIAMAVLVCDVSKDEVLAEQQQLKLLSSGFAIWSVTALLFQASLVPIIALVDADALTGIYLVVTLVALLVGGVNAITGALIAPVGRALAAGAMVRVQQILGYSGAVITIGSIVFSILLATLWSDIARIWISRADPDAVGSLFWLVAGLQVVRLSAATASVLLMAKGTTRQMIGPSALELLGLFFVALPIGYWTNAEGLLMALLTISSVAAAWTLWLAVSLCDAGRLAAPIVSIPLWLGLGFAMASGLAG